MLKISTLVSPDHFSDLKNKKHALHPRELQDVLLEIMFKESLRRGSLLREVIANSEQEI